MDNKLKCAKEFVYEAMVSLEKSIALREAAGEALGELWASHMDYDVDELLDDPAARPYWEKIELEEKAKELLVSFMFDIQAPEHAEDDEETFPQYALDCLISFNETGNIEDIKKAYWYLRAYHDFENSIEL